MGKVHLHSGVVKWSQAAELEPLIVMKHIKRVICKRCVRMTQTCPALQQQCRSSSARSQELSHAGTWHASGEVLCKTGPYCSSPATACQRFLWNGAAGGWLPGVRGCPDIHWPLHTHHSFTWEMERGHKWFNKFLKRAPEAKKPPGYLTAHGRFKAET